MADRPIGEYPQRSLTLWHKSLSRLWPGQQLPLGVRQGSRRWGTSEHLLLWLDEVVSTPTIGPSPLTCSVELFLGLRLIANGSVAVVATCQESEVKDS